MPADRIVIVPPAVYRYRQRFYGLLQESLAGEGIELQVAAGSGPPGLAHRRDESHGSWAVTVPVTWRRVAGRDIAYRDLSGLLESGATPMVIVEHAMRNLETYPLLWKAARGRMPLAMWGHGATYSRAHSRPEWLLKSTITRRSDWFFAYTREGADAVVRDGFPRQRVTNLDNSIDTVDLRRRLDRLSSATVEAERDRLGLVAGRTGLFLGGVDGQKGIDRLVDIADAVAAMVPGFVLLIAGTGDRLHAARAAEAEGRAVRCLGRVDGDATAMVLRLADVMLVPERVGLVALDAMVAGLPLVCQQTGWHGPELAYAREAGSVVAAPADVPGFARVVAGLLAQPEVLTRIGAAGCQASHGYSAESMAERFAEGLLRWRQATAARR
jgi:glycosyltransferase involved in cell wall biosynthesis